MRSLLAAVPRHTWHAGLLPIVSKLSAGTAGTPKPSARWALEADVQRAAAQRPLLPLHRPQTCSERRKKGEIRVCVGCRHYGVAPPLLCSQASPLLIPQRCAPGTVSAAHLYAVPECENRGRTARGRSRGGLKVQDAARRSAFGGTLDVGPWLEMPSPEALRLGLLPAASTR